MHLDAESTWAPGPARPRLTAGAVHVWRADLESVDGALGELLDPEERARAERLLSPRDRRRWRHARGVLRALLGLYLDVDPGSLRFHVGEHGKPALASPTLSFNLSHSGPLALYAFTPTAAVGVDVELARRSVDVIAIAKRVFGATEAERLERLDPNAREQEFRRAWVRHEAELKRLGVGLGGEARKPRQERGRSPWVVELDVGAGAAAALAVDGPPRELRQWEWPPAATFAA